MTPLASRTFDVVALGEALIDFLPSRVGPLAEVPSFERHPGGAPANVAIGVSRLGGRCAFVGTVGDDPFGAFLRNALATEGVDVRALASAAGTRTGVAFVSLDEWGRPRFFSSGGGAEFALSEQEVALAPIEEARFFHLGTYILSQESSRRAAHLALQRARAAGTCVALDPNLRIHLWRDSAPLAVTVRELLPLSDLVKLSSDECVFVTGLSDPVQAARSLLERGPRLAVVTCGADGCVYARRSAAGIESGAVPGRAAHVVDSTGAGDGFLAALLTGLSHRLRLGEDAIATDQGRLRRLLALANEAGARVCEHVGAVAGLARQAELGSLEL